MTMLNNKWCVVVGKPKDKWKTSGSNPNMDQVGQCCIGDNGGVKTFRTRKEAREYAKLQSSQNPWWNFHARKVWWSVNIPSTMTARESTNTPSSTMTGLALG